MPRRCRSFRVRLGHFQAFSRRATPACRAGRSGRRPGSPRRRWWCRPGRGRRPQRGCCRGSILQGGPGKPVRRVAPVAFADAALRGEVLALAAGYVGVQAAIAGVKRVLDAFRGLEAVQTAWVRCSVATRSASARRSNSFSARPLASVFSSRRLPMSTASSILLRRQANFRSQDTRAIFMAVAEAGRVNKLTNDQLSGSFLALTQMISKGKVQSEELRRRWAIVCPAPSRSSRTPSVLPRLSFRR